MEQIEKRASEIVMAHGFRMGADAHDYGRCASLCFFDTNDDKGQIYVVTDLIGVLRTGEAGGEIRNPIKISHQAATGLCENLFDLGFRDINARQDFMDKLWSDGIRPKALTKALNAPGVIIPVGTSLLESTQQHLADMRALLADRTGVKL